MEYPKNSLTRLKEFPDYKVYLAKLNTISDEATTLAKVQNGDKVMRWYSEWQWKDLTDNVFTLDEAQGYYHSLRFTSTPVEEGSSIMLTDECRVPATMLKRYNVCTSVTVNSPDYIVVPHVFSPVSKHSCVKLFIDEANKVVIAVSLPMYGKYMSVLPKDGWSYIPSLQNSLGDWIPNIENFLPFDNMGIYNINWPMDDRLRLAYYRYIPDKMIVPETKLFIGEHKLNYDILKSCWLMLQSSDKQMRDAAFLTLAQHDCHGYEDLLKWLFDQRDFRKEAYAMKPKNKPFAWLHYYTEMIGSSGSFFSLSRVAGRKLVSELTNGDITWNDQDAMVIQPYTNPDYLLKALAQKLN